MQNRYVGDIGDFIKFALLRVLSKNYNLGIAWYMYPDEIHNLDGRHIAYLQNQLLWRHLDEELFDMMRDLVFSERTVTALENSGLVRATYYKEYSKCLDRRAEGRVNHREFWFKGLEEKLSSCDLIFADPDNGLINDDSKRRTSRTFGKHISLTEAHRLSVGRTLVIYHHNSRFPGGHDLEVNHWLNHLGSEAFAVRANAYSCRTFFVVNPTHDIRDRAVEFSKKWSGHRVRFHEQMSR